MAAEGKKPCPTCGSEVSQSAIWCANCDLYQPDDALPQRTSKCEYCGVYVPAGSKKCYKCGARFGRWGGIDFSVASISALTALCATVITLATTIFGIAGSAWKSEAKLTIHVTRMDAQAKKIWIAAWNDGDKTGLVQSFELRFTVPQQDGSTERIFSEPLIVEASKTDVMLIHGDESIPSIALQPDVSNGHWDIVNAVKKLNPTLNDGAIGRKGEDMLSLLERIPLSCMLSYKMSAGEPKPKADPSVTIDDCAAFVRNAYAP